MSLSITAIGCLHGHYPKLEGGDLLIVTGDLTARHTPKEWIDFSIWLNNKKYQKIVFIAGNHDTMIEEWDKEQNETGYKGPVSDPNDRIEYLCNSGTEFEGLKIWGTPHSLYFNGVNEKCTAFMGRESQLKESYDLIPEGVDILISHSPPHGILDQNTWEENCGSIELRNAMMRVKPKYLICSHIHEQGGKEIDLVMTKVINCSHVDENYRPIHKPMRIVL